MILDDNRVETFKDIILSVKESYKLSYKECADMLGIKRKSFENKCYSKENKFTYKDVEIILNGVDKKLGI